MENKTEKLRALGLATALLFTALATAGTAAADPVTDLVEETADAGGAGWCITVYTDRLPPGFAIDPEGCKELIPPIGDPI